MSQSGRVIVGVGGTPTSLQALRTGIAEARGSGAPLVAVLAWTPPGGELSYRRAPCPPLLGMWEEEAVWRLRNSFDEAFGGVPQDLPVELVTIRGDAGLALVDFADRPDDLLVLGAGPHGGLARVFHGATARYCVGRARCRLLTVPAPPMLAELSRSLRHRAPLPPRELSESFLAAARKRQQQPNRDRADH